MNMINVFWTCALISLVFVSICTAEEEKTSDTVIGFEGSWTAGQYLMNITVNENGDVSATYYPIDPKTGEPGVIEGTLSEDGTELTGTWTESGVFTFTLSDDETYFNGTYASTDSNDREYSGLWDGVRKTDETSTEAAGWDGIWDSDMDILTLQVNGTAISGNYDPYQPGADDLSEPGVLEGIVSEDGKEFTGIWTETGKLLFTLSDDANSFNGTYGFGEETQMEGSVDDSWNGTRIL